MAKAKTSRKKTESKTEPPLKIPRRPWMMQALKGAIELTEDLLANISVWYYRNKCEIKTADDFVKTGQIALKCTTNAGVFGLFYDSHEIFAVAQDGKIFNNPSSSFCLDFFREQMEQGYRYSSPQGAVIRFGDSLIIVKNGDDADDMKGSINNIEQMPTISFRCLARFFTKNQQHFSSDQLTAKGFECLAKGDVLDFSSDELREVSPAQVKRLQDVKSHQLSKKANQAKVYPPEPGFVLIRPGKAKYMWHRSGSFLFAYRGCHILMGVDERTYFGCELIHKAKNIKEAYESLVPVEIRKRNCLRQGEWFIVPTNKQYKESDPEVLAIFVDRCDNDNGGLALPIDHPDSAYHYVLGNIVVVTKEGVFAQNPTLHHSEDEHNDVYAVGWHRFVRNTAKRSFSEEGVD